jgi:hypothetical protein
MSRWVAVLVVAGVGLAGGAVAFGAIPNADGNIYACYSNGDGTVRVKQDPAAPCAKGWSALKWTAGQAQVPVTTTYRKFEEAVVPAGEDELFELACNDGDVATGGGFGWVPFDAFEVAVSRPTNTAGVPDGWLVAVRNVGGLNEATAYVVCQHSE